MQFIYGIGGEGRKRRDGGKTVQEKKGPAGENLEIEDN